MSTDPAARPLTTSLAQELASEIGAIIDLHVLITDHDGVVIGSGDQSRLGSLHTPSLEVLRTLEPNTTTAEQARALRPIRPGITWPIVIAGDAVGTVGLTGAPNSVRRFGLIVQRQIEILLRESELQRSRLVREQALRDLVRDVAFFDADTVAPEALTSRAGELGIDMRLPRLAIVLDPTAASESAQGPSPLRLVRDTFTGPQDVVAELTPGRIAVLHHLRDDDPEVLCARLVDMVRQRYGYQVWAGVGELAHDVTGLHHSYQDASAAARLGPTVGSHTRVNPITRLRIHQLLDATGHQARSHFVEALLGELRDAPGWPETRRTLMAWVTSGFNLVRAAERLHIHRNTLIYRLDKVSQLSGQQVRDPAAGVAVFLACVLDQMDVIRPV